MAVIAALPITAMADYTFIVQNTPAAVPQNGTVTISNPSMSNSYLQTITINDDDDEHIASTAYVKGAYNDAIAAINAKQTRLYNDNAEEYMHNTVLDTDSFLMALGMVENVGSYLNGEADLVSAAAVQAGIQSQRVEVWTTWDNDNATTDVAFKTVVPQD